jgi:hypothetical protein
MSVEIRRDRWPEAARIGDRTLRRPDGSIDIRAYAAIAHRQRTEAVQAYTQMVVQSARKAWSAISALAVGPARPVAGKGCVQTSR